MRNVGLMWALAAGCSANGGGGGGCNNGGGGADLVMTDVNNYKIDEATTDMAFGHVTVQQETDFCFDWSGMTTDIRGRPLDPTTIEQVLLVDFPYDEIDLVSKIVDENYIPQEGVSPFIFDNTTTGGGTYACATEMNVVGTDLTPDLLVPEEGRTWLLSLVKFPGAVQEIQQVMLIDFQPAGVNEVAFADGMSSITIGPDLGSKPIETAADLGTYTLDWSDLEKDVNGKAWDNLVGDKLFIVNYDGTVEDIEADFLLLDYHATAVYDLDVRGKTSAILNEASTEEGETFAGFTTDGTWVVGIACSSCISPIPVAIAVVNVAAE
jgi:hypothetical protein